MISRRSSRVSGASGASIAAVIFAARAAAAQAPGPALAQLKDDEELAQALHSITHDPVIAVDDPAIRPLVQALVIEGVRQARAGAYDQALANFLAGYARFPSPTLLLDVAAILRDMGRLADAANTYQRYLADPAAGSERVAEIQDVLGKLDQELAILVVRVVPHGSNLAIDGGPFIPVGSSLVTRVRSGLHRVQIRGNDSAPAPAGELSISCFEGETKEITATLPGAAPRDPWQASPRGAVEPSEAAPGAPAIAPERVDGWLIIGTQYGAADAASRERTVYDTGEHELAAIVPRYEVSDRGDAMFGDRGDDALRPGVVGVVRIDGKGRGFASGLGIAISRGAFEAEAMLLRSDETGGYLGCRYRVLRGWLRPYLAVGVPGFVYDHQEVILPSVATATMTTARLAVGARVAAGVELMINGHLSVQGDLGYEHFFFLGDRFEADVFVPTLGVIGRL